jgi:large subunit ribosomal protein L2
MFKFYSIIRSTSGRNNSGSITVRHRGSARFSKKTFNFFTPHSVSDSSFTRYFFPRIPSGKPKLYVKFGPLATYTFGVAKNAISGPLHSFKPGTFVRDIAGTPKGFPKYVRSRYSRALLIKRFGTRATLRIPSGEIRKFKSSCVASVCPNKSHVNLIKVAGFKAGYSRSIGIRPHVRGCAINPVDHPHGGRTGESRPSVSPWAKLTKGYRTRTKRLDKKRIVLSAQQFHDRQNMRLF